jgi:hypothetical protein
MTEPKTLDEIAKWHCSRVPGLPYRWFPLITSAIRAALDEARDLGRAERDKEWQKAVGMHVSSPDTVAHIFAAAKKRMDEAVAERDREWRAAVDYIWGSR